MKDGYDNNKAISVGNNILDPVILNAIIHP